MHIYTLRLHNYFGMTKLARQQLIVELAHDGPLPNQQELVKVLARRGFAVTQATLSRDINELRPGSHAGRLHAAEWRCGPQNRRLPFHGSYVSLYATVRRAQNLLVIKTTSGSAQPVALAVDAEGWEEVVGTVAGDDTVLIITPGQQKRQKAADTPGGHARLMPQQSNPRLLEQPATPVLNWCACSPAIPMLRSPYSSLATARAGTTAKLDELYPHVSGNGGFPLQPFAGKLCGPKA